MENTSILLLASDGAFTITFTPGLTAEQYADLNQVVTAGLLTKAQFCEKFAALALVWEVKFESDGVCKED
jgi:hypothetical protein